MHKLKQWFQRFLQRVTFLQKENISPFEMQGLTCLECRGHFVGTELDIVCPSCKLKHPDGVYEITFLVDERTPACSRPRNGGKTVTFTFVELGKG